MNSTTKAAVSIAVAGVLLLAVLAVLGTLRSAGGSLRAADPERPILTPGALPGLSGVEVASPVATEAAPPVAIQIGEIAPETEVLSFSKVAHATFLAGDPFELPALDPPADPTERAAFIARLYQQMVGDPDGELRAQAVRSLGSLRDPSLAPILAQALGDRNSRVRAMAARALGRLGDAAAIANLEPLLADAVEPVRLAAERAIERIRDPSIGEQEGLLFSGLITLDVVASPP